MGLRIQLCTVIHLACFDIVNTKNSVARIEFLGYYKLMQLHIL